VNWGRRTPWRATSLEHTEYSGSIILENEPRFLGRPLPVPRQGTCAPDAMIGHTRLRLFLEQTLNTFSSLSLRGLSVTVTGNELQVAWTLCGTSLGVEVTFSGREHFRFSEAGKFTEVLVGWDATWVSHALRQALAPDPAEDLPAARAFNAEERLSATA